MHRLWFGCFVQRPDVEWTERADGLGEGGVAGGVIVGCDEEDASGAAVIADLIDLPG